MKDAHSISTRRAYGVQRVCRVWPGASAPPEHQHPRTSSPLMRQQRLFLDRRTCAPSARTFS